jgi:cytosine/adenosine deaminase-related metal-dependent hydrolase
MSTRTVFADWLLPQPGAAALQGVAIEIDGSLIAGISQAGRQHAASSNAKPRRLVLPALSNAHDHARVARNSAMGGFDKPLESWLFRLALIPTADPWLCSAVSFGRSALGGVGAIMIHYTRIQGMTDFRTEVGQVVKALRDVGLRGAFAVQCRDRNPIVYGPHDAVLASLSSGARAAMEKRFLKTPLPAREQVTLVEAIAEEYESPGLTVQFGPAAVQWCSDALLRLIAERSAATGRRVHMHLLETKYQRAWADRQFPQGIVRYLDDIGLLSPRLSLAHCVWAQPDEYALIAERGATIVVNTSSNLAIRSGRAAIDQMLRAGCRVAMGMDGVALDEDEDALREMRLNYALNKGAGFGAAMSPAALQAFATTNGRFALDGSTAGGRIELGGDADLLSLDLDQMSSDLVEPDVPAMELMLARASKSHVCDLIVAGQDVVQDGKLVKLDLPTLEAELLARLRRDIGTTADLRAAMPELERALAERFAVHTGCC